MAATCKHLGRLKSQLLRHDRSWARGLAIFSKKGDKNEGNKNSSESDPKPWGPDQEKAVSEPHVEPKLFWGHEPLPERFRGEHLPDPVRNTEREYFQAHANPDLKGPFDGKFYTRKHGISKEVYSWLQWCFNINDDDEIRALSQYKNFEQLKDDQRYVENRTKAVGYELGAAHFVLARGGAIKFVNRDHWYARDAKGQYPIPRTYVEDLCVEAIDASNMPLTYMAFDTIGRLSQLRFLKLHNCPHIDDWCLSRLQRLKHSLEVLDLSNCPGITDNGLSSLHCLHNLRGLRLSNLPNVQHLGLLILLLEEHLPNLMILGANDQDLKPPAWEHRGERRLVRALLGYTETDEVDEHNKKLEEMTKNKIDEELNDVRTRGIRHVD